MKHWLATERSIIYILTKIHHADLGDQQDAAGEHMREIRNPVLVLVLIHLMVTQGTDIRTSTNGCTDHVIGSRTVLRENIEDRADHTEDRTDQHLHHLNPVSHFQITIPFPPTAKPIILFPQRHLDQEWETL